MKLRPLLVTLLLAFLTALQFYAAEQYSARILRSVNRSPDFHPSQAAVFRFDVLRGTGGVLSQTSRLLTATDDGPFSITLDLQSGEYPGHVLVRHSDTTVPYSIEYSHLVPMALFVDSGGTTLYTLWDADDERLPDNFLRAAGFVTHSIRGHVALEFHNTSYSDALYFLDLCQDCIAPDQALAVGDDLIRALRESADAEDSSHINTDVGLPFIFSTDTGWADLDGRIARFRWDASSLGASITASPVLPAPPWGFSAAFDLFLANPQLNDDLETSFAVALSMTTAVQSKLNESYFLFETLALLRTAKNDDPEQWSQFMQLLSSDALVAADPYDSWGLYTESYCIVYSEERECQP